MLSELLALVSGDLACVSHIALVADENARDVVGGVLLNLIHPVLDGAEALAVSDVVGDNDAVSALVVAAGDRLEALLSCGVPDLQLNRLAVHLDRADLEVDADGGDEGLGVGVLGEAQEQAALSDAAVADEQQLEEVVAKVCALDNLVTLTIPDCSPSFLLSFK